MTAKEYSSIEKVEYLNSKLGPTLVAAAIGMRDRSCVSEVSANLEEILTVEQKLRLDALLEVWTAVANSEGDDIARAWFIGANPWLGDESAVSAIREDRFSQVRAAAQTMVDDTPNF